MDIIITTTDTPLCPLSQCQSCTNTIPHRHRRRMICTTTISRWESYILRCTMETKIRAIPTIITWMSTRPTPIFGSRKTTRPVRYLNLTTNRRIHHLGPGLPSCGSPTAADVCQPPQLRSPYSWVDMPPHHIQYSGPAYAASTIAPTTTTQGRSCQEYPVDVQQPLLRPTSPYCSKLTPLAVTAVLIPPPPPLSPGSSTAQLLAAAPPPPSPSIFFPCSPDKIHTLSIIPAAAALSQVDDSKQPSLLHLPCSMKEYKPKTCEVQVHESDGVNIHYKRMWTDGTIFNPTFERGDPIDIELGRGQVMKRWLLVLGMCLGEKRKLKIPSKLNYGEHVFDPGGFLVVASWFPP